MAVRYYLRGPPKLWEKIDALPLPPLMKDLLKLKNVCPDVDVSCLFKICDATSSDDTTDSSLTDSNSSDTDDDVSDDVSDDVII